MINDILSNDSLPSLTAATSSSSKKMTRLVCSMTAEASEAKKYSTSFSSVNGINSVVDSDRCICPPLDEVGDNAALDAPFVRECPSVRNKRKIQLIFPCHDCTKRDEQSDDDVPPLVMGVESDE